ncbi:MAG TPA: hypothetical protein VGJ26_00935 [Pirellulales bacterium]
MIIRRPFLAAFVVTAAIPLAAACADPYSMAPPDEAPPVVEKKPNIVKRAWMHVCRDFRRSNAWPDPFVTVDRVAVREPFAAEVANGWRLQNTLGEQYFEADSPTLTEAGRLKIARIINETPTAYRAIFVLRSEDPVLNADRVAMVQQSAARTLGERPPVPIFETYEKPRGAPANYIDAVNEKYEATIPDPRVPMEEGASVDAGSLP